VGQKQKSKLYPTQMGISQVILKVMRANISSTIATVQMDENWLKKLKKAYQKDLSYKEVTKKKKKFEIISGLVYVKSDDKLKKLWIPNDQEIKVMIMHNSHDSSISAHSGVCRTQLLYNSGIIGETYLKT